MIKFAVNTINRAEQSYTGVEATEIVMFGAVLFLLMLVLSMLILVAIVLLPVTAVGYYFWNGNYRARAAELLCSQVSPSCAASRIRIVDLM